jgi:hypothetical protein
MNVVIPLLSSVISLVFAITVFDQYLARRKPYQLVWTIGLLIYFVSTGCEFLVEAFGLSAFPYRLWYLGGAIFAAAYLGMGTIYLLAPRRVANTVMVLLGVASLFAIYKVFTAPVDLSLLPGEELLSGKAFPSGWAGPRLLTPFFNIFGTVALVGGALYSAAVYWRRRLMPHRVVSNILIAVGAFFPALGGSLARLGNPNFLYLFELLGVTIIFLGFLRSREVFGLYRFPLIHGFRRLPE